GPTRYPVRTPAADDIVIIAISKQEIGIALAIDDVITGFAVNLIAAAIVPDGAWIHIGSARGVIDQLSSADDNPLLAALAREAREIGCVVVIICQVVQPVIDKCHE